MGKHQLGWLPPNWDHRQRFIIAFVGIVALAFTALAVVALIFAQ
ncbi:MAG TPA: hypothetical protein VH561_05425 [Micromonosporaceae bacterium]|jgi:hypothetical protein